MIQMFADGVLAYDSRLEQYDLEALQITTGVNGAGSATFTMPLGHPAYNSFVSFRTIVTIYRGGELRFRGRVLYANDDYHGRRTITCEGERCLLGDGIMRPYKYPNPLPSDIFQEVINNYNQQMTNYAFKQFLPGRCDISPWDNQPVFASEEPETHLAVLNKLVELYRGFLTFTDDPDTGQRVINWVYDPARESSQQIEFGENLLDFTITEANNPDFATTIIPYGAKTTAGKETGQRLTITEVNGGKDYVTNEQAKAIYGNIVTTITWDEVTDATKLRERAAAALATRSVLASSLELSALDLSIMDKSVDSFSAGDYVRVVSKPHGVDTTFQLTQMTEDLLHPEKSRIILGKDTPALTRASVASVKSVSSTLSGYATKDTLNNYATTDDLSAYATKGDLTGYATTEALAGYATKGDLNNYAPKSALDNYATTTRAEYLAGELSAEISNRAGIINKVNGTVHISGGAPVNILGGKIDIDGSEINFGSEIRFPNTYGVRIADKDGNYYYVLRVDNANSCVVGNDYTNLYLRGKEAVYLHKTGAVVTSDQREKNSVEEIPGAYEAMLDKLTPVRFRYNGRGDRYHIGFVAQDVAQAMTEAGLSPEDFGGFVDLNGDGSHLGLAYDEFIGLLLDKIRRLEKRIEKLEE
jgi:hypothetical protein